MQCEHADFVVFTAIAGEFAAAGEEDEIIGAVPVLDDVETFVDLTAQRLAMQIPAQEDGFDGFAEFRERLVGWVLNVASDKAAQDRLGLGGAEPDSRDVLDHLVVLLADE